MNNIASQDQLRNLLESLDDQLELLKVSFELVVIGGAGLIALNASTRATRDVDVVAIEDDGVLLQIEAMPSELETAVARVAADFNLDRDWLNAGPAELLRFDLPEGFHDRLESYYDGKCLKVRLASRKDQIHFKLYALADGKAGGKHENDLKLLSPTEDELIAAARWTRTHDPSEGHLMILTNVLVHLGIPDAADRI